MSVQIFSSTENVIPRMKFEELNTIGSLPHNSSSFSLSGALLSENNNISFHNSSSHNMEDNSQPTQSSLPSIQSYSQFRGNNNPVSVQSNTYSVDNKLSVPFQGYLFFCYYKELLLVYIFPEINFFMYSRWAKLVTAGEQWSPT